MYIPFFSESASPQKKLNEIRSVFSLLHKQLRKKYSNISLSHIRWCYVLLPGRIDSNYWKTVQTKGYRCLYRQSNVPFAIIPHPDDDFYPAITEILSNHNDFIYFIAFATNSSLEDDQLLTWIDILMKNESVNMLPPYALLTFESGNLIL